MTEKQNPAALAACGAPQMDQLGSSIYLDNSHVTRRLQALRISRRCTVSYGMASIVASFIHGEAHS